MVYIEYVKLVVEGIFTVNYLETWQIDLNLLFKGLSGSGSEVVVDTVACALSNSTKRVFPY